MKNRAILRFAHAFAITLHYAAFLDVEWPIMFRMFSIEDDLFSNISSCFHAAPTSFIPG